MISTGQTIKTSKTANTLVFIILMLIGLFSTYHLAYLPLMKILDAQKWVPLTCEVISSSISTSHGSHASTTYQAKINYRYEYEGNTYTNNKYRFQEYYTSAYNHEYNIVRAYSPLRQFTCFVNPQNPKEAVIDREPGLYLLFCLFPLIFLVVGLGGLYSTLKKPLDVQQDKQTGKIILKEKSTPLTQFLIILFICIFWNSIVLVMASDLLVPNQRGSIPLSDILFSSVFIFLGLLLVLGVFYSFLNLFNPKITIELNNAYLVLNESYQLDFMLSGKFNRLRSLKIDLIATQQITSRSGNKTKIEEKIVFQKNIYECIIRVPQNTSVNFATPSTAELNFSESFNQLKWTLKATGAIGFWPDMSHEFEIVLYPDKKEVESWLNL